MCKHLAIAGIIISLAILSGGCKDDYSLRSDTSTVDRISFTVDEYEETGEDSSPTRTGIRNNTEFFWTEGDTVGIYPNTGAQVYFAMEEGTGASSTEFNGGGWALKQSAEYYSYYPFIGDIYLDRHRIPVSYDGQKQTGLTGVDHIGAYDYMYTDATSSESGNLSFSYHHLGCIIRPKLTLPAGTYTKLAITAPSEVFVKSGWFDLQPQGNSVSINGTKFSNQIAIDLGEISVDGSTTFLVYVMSAPVNLKDTEITISVLNDQKKELQCKKTPSANYTAGRIGGLTCSSWTEVPQSMGMIIDGWDDGGNLGGDAE